MDMIGSKNTSIDEESMQSPYVLKYIVENFNEPLIFHESLQWDLFKWDLEKWKETLGNEELQFRCGKNINTKNPQWESTTETVKGTFSEFLNFTETSPDKWLYFDYKYLKEWFLNNEELRNIIKWEPFGYPDKNYRDSTIWIGSKRAHTPCHIDTYGFNLVTQIYGKKLWLLFPPEENLLPTRLPYEESSVYSKINFFSPDCITYKGALSKCRMVILEAGDVLFVPNGWWHYVENLDVAISVNIWLPLASDDEKRLEESIVQSLISLFLKTTKDGSIPTNQETPPFNQTINVLNKCLRLCKTNKYKSNPSLKLSKPNIKTLIDESEGKIEFVKELPAEKLQELLKEQRNRFTIEENEEECEKSTGYRFLEALTHPDVIDLVKLKLLKA